MAYVLFDPVTLTLAAGALATSVIGGLAARAEAQGQAADIKAQRKANALQASRDQLDTQNNTGAAVARRRALLAANGGAGSASATELLNATAANGGTSLNRMATDASISSSALKARQANTIAAGNRALVTSIGEGAVGAGTQLYAGGIFSSKPKKPLVGDNGMIVGGI